MTSRCSRECGEDLRHLRSATSTEPPTRESPDPALDEAVTDPGLPVQWGNTLGKKGATAIRVVLQNVDGFSQDDNMDLKTELLRQFVTDQEVDVFGFTKANTCWDLLPPKHRLPERTHGWWENSHWSLGYNWVETQTSTYQPGGTGVLVVNQLSHRILRSGDDPTGMVHGVGYT